MKTRIISGAVMGVIVAAFLALGYLINTLFICGALALLAGIACFELLHNALKLNNKLCEIGAYIYSAVAVVAFRWSYYAYIIISVVFFLFAVLLTLKNHQKFSLAQFITFCAMPILLSFAFSCLNNVVSLGLYYFLLLFNFSSVCDMGAYFTGTFLGKHKLCPTISPKKTVEGAIGGIISSMIITLVLAFCFKKAILIPIILTVPMCIVGMLGDLFASAIKRSVDLKDYGKLIPGHGGILDRVDSIIMIVPLMYVFTLIGVL